MTFNSIFKIIIILLLEFPLYKNTKFSLQKTWIIPKRWIRPKKSHVVPLKRESTGNVSFYWLCFKTLIFIGHFHHFPS